MPILLSRYHRFHFIKDNRLIFSVKSFRRVVRKKDPLLIFLRLTRQQFLIVNDSPRLVIISSRCTKSLPNLYFPKFIPTIDRRRTKKYPYIVKLYQTTATPKINTRIIPTIIFNSTNLPLPLGPIRDWRNPAFEIYVD